MSTTSGTSDSAEHGSGVSTPPGAGQPLPPGIEGDSLQVPKARAEDYPPGQEPPSVLILTKDEEINIEDCLKSVSFSDDIVVFDSYSGDRTCEIARKHPNVRIIKRRFDVETAHRNWALEKIGYKHPWVYCSDADERVTPELRDEMLRVINTPGDPYVAFRLRYKNMFFRRWVRWGGVYPVWIIRLVRPERTRYEERAINIHPLIDGPLGDLRQHFIHYSFNKGLLPWFRKHNWYSDGESKEAVRVLEHESISDKLRKIPSGAPGVRRRAIKDLSFFLPFRGLVRFLYMYFLRLGFLDGAPGFHYASMIAMYEYWIEVKIREQRRAWRDRTDAEVARLLHQETATDRSDDRADAFAYPTNPATGAPLVDIMIPTFNEAAHIKETVENARQLGPVYVLDSFSTDGTQELARRAGATVIEHPFEDYSRQKNWGLDNLPLKGDWTFILDADERITPELREEVLRTALDPTAKAGYLVNRVVLFMGRQIRHGGLFPSWNLRFFRRGSCRYEDRSVHEHMICNGETGYLKHLMLHIRRETLSQFIAKHIKYADMESHEWYKAKVGEGGGAKPEHLFRHSLRFRQWLRRRIWPGMPFKPMIRFGYMYFVRLGFLDGSAGWHFAWLMASYEYMIGLLYRDRLARSKDPRGYGP